MEAQKKRKISSVINQELIALVKQGKLHEIQVLLKEGAEINSIDPENYNSKPIHVAAQFGHKAMVEFFLENGVCIEEVDKDGWTALHYGAKGGKLNVVEYLVQLGADINLGSILEGTKPIHLAASNGHTYIIEYFLKNGVSIEEIDKDGWTVLHYGAKGGKQNVIEYLVEHGANINSSSIDDGGKPIHLVAEFGHRNSMEFFIRKGVDIEETNEMGWTCLHYASRGGNLDIVQYLLDNGATINIADFCCGDKPIHIAAKNGNKQVVEAFLDRKVDIGQTNYKNMTPLHWAAEHGHFSVVDFLINKNVDIHTISADGKEPLHTAALRGHKNIVNLLLEAGASIENRNTDGWTPFHFAVGGNQIEVAEFLIHKKAKINAITRNGKKPIHIAAVNNCKDIIELLLNKENLYVDEPCSEYRWTALHYASREGNLEIVTLLIEKKANIHAKTIAGLFPIHAAAFGGHEKVIQLLISVGACVDSCDNSNMTPLHFAALKGQFKVAKFLTSKNADIHSKSYNGEEPIHVAAQEGHVKIIELLLNSDRNLKSNEVFHVTENADYRDKADSQIYDNRSLCYTAEKMLQEISAVDVQDNENNTPLHFASYWNKTNSMEYLLKAGARSDIKDKEGRTALYYYVSNNCKKNIYLSIDILEKFHNYTDIDNKGKKTAAHLVLETPCAIAFFETILNFQNDLNLEDIDGSTPLNYLTDELSVYQGEKRVELIKLLINNGAFLKQNDCEWIIENMFLRNKVLTDVKLCTKSIINKFKNKDLPEVFRFSIHLPPIENMKIGENQMLCIENSVENAVKSKGFCDVSKNCFKPLNFLCVESFVSIPFYDASNGKKSASEAHLTINENTSVKCNYCVLQNLI